MPVLLLLLALGVIAYLYWRRRTTSLTRNCRWRFSRARGGWQCAYCGGAAPGADPPRHCAAPPAPWH